MVSVKIVLLLRSHKRTKREFSCIASMTALQMKGRFSIKKVKLKNASHIQSLIGSGLIASPSAKERDKRLRSLASAPIALISHYLINNRSHALTQNAMTDKRLKAMELAVTAKTIHELKE